MYCGYKVIEASNADEAMPVLLHQGAPVDVVFSDIDMPGAVDGFGLAKWIREHDHPGYKWDKQHELFGEPGRQT
jgi:DNA-binding LytR/AlgR family response regulator